MQDLDRDEFQQLFRDLGRGMNRLARSNSVDHKKIFGEKYTFVSGISKSYSLYGRSLREGELNVYIFNKKFNKIYEEYGYGAYGRGLEAGQEIVTKGGYDFDIDDEPDFDIS